MAACDGYATPASRQAIWTKASRSRKDRLQAVFQEKTDSRVLRPYAGFEAARAIGVLSNRVPVRGIRIKPNVGCCGIGLPETFSTCGLNIHLCGLCRERGSEERDEQSDGEKSSYTKLVASLKVNTPSVSGGRARTKRFRNYCQPGSEYRIPRQPHPLWDRRLSLQQSNVDVFVMLTNSRQAMMKPMRHNSPRALISI
jgi:hypothetical protein